MNISYSNIIIYFLVTYISIFSFLNDFNIDSGIFCLCLFSWFFISNNFSYTIFYYFSIFNFNFWAPLFYNESENGMSISNSSSSISSLIFGMLIFVSVIFFKGGGHHLFYCFCNKSYTFAFIWLPESIYFLAITLRLSYCYAYLTYFDPSKHFFPFY